MVIAACTIPGCGATFLGHTGQCDEHRAKDHSPSWYLRRGRVWRVVRGAVLLRDGFVCRFCGAPADTVDHVRPVSLGGTNSPTNLVAACTACNTAKSDDLAPRRPAGDPNEEAPRAD